MFEQEKSTVEHGLTVQADINVDCMPCERLTVFA